MEDWNKKTGLRGLLSGTLEDFYKAPDAPTPSLADLARGLLSSKMSEPSGIGLAGALAQDGIGLAEDRSTNLAKVARALLAPAPGTEAFIDAVWERAPIVEGYDPRYIRRDRFGFYIARFQHGEYSVLGWHMDHILAKSLGGSDLLYNREPLHWRNNLAKSDSVV